MQNEMDYALKFAQDRLEFEIMGLKHCKLCRTVFKPKNCDGESNVYCVSCRAKMHHKEILEQIQKDISNGLIE